MHGPFYAKTHFWVVHKCRCLVAGSGLEEEQDASSNLVGSAAMLRGAFGEQLGRSFGVGNPPTLVRRTSAGLPVAVTEIQFEHHLPGVTLPIPREDAYLIGLQLCDVRHHEMWSAGQLVSSGSWPKGATMFYDLSQHPVVYCEEPFHQLMFYASKRAMAEVCEFLDARDSALNVVPGQACNDETVRRLGDTLLPYLRDGAGGRVVDHLLYALCGHVAERYGPQKLVCSRRVSGGLAPWQQRRARELLRESMASGVTLQAVADACRLSSSSFRKGFKKNMGVSPHQWLLTQRVDRSIELMQSTTMPLVEIALACGFSDQSHFTRMFTQKMGISPGAYRREWPKQAA
jgi:AraC family transcriptional regulator